MVSRGAYRFDDPADEVGIETMLVGTADGPVHHVPLTYRAAPLDGADDWLVGTTEHSVLGTRWVYDGCADPVYAAALAHAILAGGGQAEQYFEVDGRREVREPTVTIAVSGAGDADVPPVGAVRRVVDEDNTTIVTDSVDLVVVRRPGAGPTPPGPPCSADGTGSRRACRWRTPGRGERAVGGPTSRTAHRVHHCAGGGGGDTGGRSSQVMVLGSSHGASQPPSLPPRSVSVNSEPAGVKWNEPQLLTPTAPTLRASTLANEADPAVRALTTEVPVPSTRTSRNRTLLIE